jgi:predicted nucleotidyltransferase
MDKKTNQNIIDFISFLAKENPRIVKAFLFGSYARNLNKPDSDIDIALVVKDLSDDEVFDLQVQLLLMASKYDSRIEPHVISNNDLETNNPFVFEIIKTGIEINPQMPKIA